jgi:hypothetical protein
MALAPLRLDLAPPGTFWRLHHGALGWSGLGAGALALALALGVTARAYDQAAQAGKREVQTRARAVGAEESRRRVLEQLRAVDVTHELPRWRLAERILTERGLPWSRLTAELERSLVPGVRVKSLQRSRGADRRVQIKVKGEARTREAEVAFMGSLQKNGFFEQVILERESERQGGGVDFEFTLAAQPAPPPYTPLEPGRPRGGGG